MAIEKICSWRADADTDTSTDVLDLPSVAIIIPTLNEEKYIGRPTLESLRKQTLPSSSFELLVVDSNSTDRTQDIAKSYGANVISAGRGKLTARDIGIRAANTDLIVSCDADCYYPPSWIEKTLAAFKDNSNVVGVTGPRLYDKSFTHDLTRLFYSACWRFFGSNSAFLRKAYFMSGGFNLSIDQTDSKKMIDEEEVLFRNRLAAFGNIEYQPDNPIYTSSRRFSRKDKSFCMAIAKGERF